MVLEILHCSEAKIDYCFGPQTGCEEPYAKIRIRTGSMLTVDSPPNQQEQ